MQGTPNGGRSVADRRLGQWLPMTWLLVVLLIVLVVLAVVAIQSRRRSGGVIAAKPNRKDGDS